MRITQINLFWFIWAALAIGLCTLGEVDWWVVVLIALAHVEVNWDLKQK